MKTYWRIKFDDKRDGFGWLEWNESNTEAKIFDDGGIEITTAVSYTTVDTESSPEWSA